MLAQLRSERRDLTRAKAPTGYGVTKRSLGQAGL
jgi:hypothetical protein